MPDKINEAPIKWYNASFSLNITIANIALSNGIN